MEPPFPSVQYSHGEPSVKFFENEGTSTATQKRGRLERRFLRRNSLICIAKVLIPVSLIIAGPALTFFILQHHEKASIAGHHAPLSALPNVVNLSLVSTSTSAFTVTWERPEGYFDYYSFEVAADDGKNSGSYEMNHAGSCGNAVIIDPDQTVVTCTHLTACTYLNFTVRTIRSSPKKESSTGVTLHDIFISGPEPDPPEGISVAAVSSSISRLHWNPPETTAKTFLQYTVKVCDTLSACDEGQILSGCTKNQANVTWLEFESKPDTTYCVFITTSSACGEQVLRSRPAAVQVRTPLIVPQAPAHLTAARKETSTVELNWKAPAEAEPDSGFLYSIELCETCFGGDRGLCCWTRNTTHTSLAFNSTADKNMWVQVTSGRPCGEEVIWSKPAVENFAFAPLDVTALQLGVVINDSFTATWRRPRDHFDYYLVQALSRSKGIQGTTDIIPGPCGNGTIVHSEQTQVTCGPFTPHATVDLIVRTHRIGPPQRSSAGVTLEGICIPGAAGPPEVVKLNIAAKGTNAFTVTWVRPEGCFHSYLVDFMDKSTNGSNTEQHSLGTCSNTTVDRDQTSITCSHVPEWIDVIDVKVRTRVTGPPARTSAGVMTRHIFFEVEDLEDFYPSGRYSGFDKYATISITFGSKFGSGLRRMCYGEVKCYNLSPVSFKCNSHEHGSIKVYVKMEVTGVLQTCHVTLVNPRNSRSAVKRVTVPYS